MATLENSQPMFSELMELPLTSSQAGSRAKTFPSPAERQELRMAQEAGFGQRSLGLLASYDQKSSIVENVANLLSGPSERPGAWFGRVLGDLAKIGYDAEWRCLPASYIGAWHRRDRVWLVAYPNEVSRQQGKPERPLLGIWDLLQQFEGGFERWPGRSNLPQSRICGKNDGIPDVSHRLAALGNSVVPAIPELIGHAILKAMAAS